MAADVVKIPGGARGRHSAVVSDGLVYAVATDPTEAEGVTAQTEATLAKLQGLLEQAGSGKELILQATVYLADMSQKKAMDAVWCDWIGEERNWPQRACVGVTLEGGCLVEIVVTARVA